VSKPFQRLTPAEIEELSTEDEREQLEQIGFRLDALNDELLDLAAERQTIFESLKLRRQQKGTL
jgi:chorismate mutase